MNTTKKVSSSIIITTLLLIVPIWFLIIIFLGRVLYLFGLDWMSSITIGFLLSPFISFFVAVNLEGYKK